MKALTLRSAAFFWGLIAVALWQPSKAFTPPPSISRGPFRHGGFHLYPKAALHSLPRRQSSLEEDGKASNGGGGGLFRFLTSDTLSLSVGTLGLLALTINRLATENLYDSQSRTDILGVIAAGGLLLNGLTLQDITARDAEPVELEGIQVNELDSSLTYPQKQTLSWAAETFQKALPNIPSVVIWYDGKTVLRMGLASPSAAPVKILSILGKAVLEAVPESDGISPVTYIPDLQILPGRNEFPYLPDLCQSVVIQPFGDKKGIVILGGNKARNLNPKDLARIRMVTQKVQSTLVT